MSTAGWRWLGYLIAFLMACAMAIEPFEFLLLHVLALVVGVAILACTRFLKLLHEKMRFGVGHSAVLLTVLSAAYFAPVKEVDTRTVGPFQSTLASLQVLRDARVVSCPPELEHLPVTLPSSSPTFKETIAAIESTGSLRCRVEYCLSGATLLWGAYIRRISVMRL